MPRSFIPNLRMNSIYGSDPAPTDFSQQDFFNPQPAQPIFDSPVLQPEYDPQARMSELYQPEHAAGDRFKGMVENYPQYESPGFWRSAAAALSSFGPGGHKVGMEVANFNNDRKQADWKNQIGPAQQAASIERQDNANSRTAAYNQVTTELRGAAQKDKVVKDARTASNNEARTKIMQYKLEHPDWKLVPGQGGNAVMVNPQTHETVDLGVPRGSLTKEDELRIGQENALERIDETGSVSADNAKALETQRQAGRVQIAGMPARTTAGGTKGLTPAGNAKQQFNNAQQLFNERPDLANFLTLDPGGKFTIQPPGDGGPSFEQWNKIKQVIYGSPYTAQPVEAHDPASDAIIPPDMPAPPPQFGGAPTPTPVPSPQVGPTNAPPAVAPKLITRPDGKVRVINKDGTSGWIPQAQLQGALANGFTIASS